MSIRVMKIKQVPNGRDNILSGRGLRAGDETAECLCEGDTCESKRFSKTIIAGYPRLARDANERRAPGLACMG